jgi:hypothetical protein
MERRYFCLGNGSNETEVAYSEDEFELTEDNIFGLQKK